MDAKKLAAMLDGRQMGSEITEAEETLARKAGLVVVFGYSDDNVELRGAIRDEASAYNGTPVYLGAEGLLKNDCDDDRCPHFLRERERAPSFKAKWDDGDGAAWSYEVPWPHETFRVMEADDLFCVGVVFALADVSALAARGATASPAPKSDEVREAAERLTRDDAMTLIGHAEYLRRVHGETDMPRFFDGLAKRLLSALAARGGA